MQILKQFLLSLAEGKPLPDPLQILKQFLVSLDQGVDPQGCLVPLHRAATERMMARASMARMATVM